MIVTPAPYLPFLDAHKGKPPGLWAMPPEDWLEIDAAYAPQMAYRDELIAREGAEVAAIAEDPALAGAAAVAELSSMLRDHLGDRYAHRFARRGDEIRRPDGVIVALDGGVAALGRLVQEDFCLMAQAPGETRHRLIAANLCFPSHWRLQEKLGLPLIEVHTPVPGYAEGLDARVERVHAALAVERPLQRLNFSVHPTPELHLVDAPASYALSAPTFFLRVERQTLRRLPETRAIVFGIKTYVTPFADVPTEARRALAERLDALPPAMAAYKGGAAVLSRAIEALRADA